MIHGHGGNINEVSRRFNKLSGGLSGQIVWEKLARKKILIRRCSNIKRLSDGFIRISLKKESNNRMLAARLNALSHELGSTATPHRELRVAYR